MSANADTFQLRVSVDYPGKWYLWNGRGYDSQYLQANGTLSSAHHYFDTKEEAEAFLKQWQIDWITPEYVQQEAAKGDKEALDCSILHWQQIVDAGYAAFKVATGLDKVRIYMSYCALCTRHRHYMTPFDLAKLCSSCPLESCSKGSLWLRVEDARCDKNAAAFESAAAALLAKLKEEREKLDIDKSQFQVKASCADGEYYISTDQHGKLNSVLYPDGTLHEWLSKHDTGVNSYFCNQEAAERFLAEWRGEKYVSKEEKEQQYKELFQVHGGGDNKCWITTYAVGVPAAYLQQDATLKQGICCYYWLSHRCAEVALLKWQGKPVTPKHGDIVLNLEGKKRLIVHISGSFFAVASNWAVWAGPGLYWTVEQSYSSTVWPYTVVGNIFEGDKWTSN